MLAPDTANDLTKSPRGVPFPAEPTSQGLTPGAVTEAVVALMRAANPNREPDTALAANIAGGITPSLQQDLALGRAATGQELLSGSAFTTAVTQYLGSPNAGYLDDGTRKGLLARLEQANVSSADSVAIAGALGIYGPLQASQRSSGSSNASASSTDSGKRYEALSIGSIQTDAEYRGAPATAHLVAAGVTFQTFQKLRADGFSPTQMVAATTFTKSLGLDANQSVVHVAHIQRARSEDANDAMRDTSANWKRVAGLEKELADAKAQGSPQEKIDGIQKQLREEREYSRNYDTGYQRKVETSAPGEGRHYDAFSQQIQAMEKRGVKAATSPKSQIDDQLRQNKNLSAAEKKARNSDIASQKHISEGDTTRNIDKIADAAPTRPQTQSPTTPKTVKLDL